MITGGVSISDLIKWVLSPTGVISLLLLANTVFAFVWFLWGVKEKNMRIRMDSFVILVCPLIGPFYYAITQLIYKTFYYNNEMSTADITFSREQKRKIENLDYYSEIEVVPIEEALLASNEDDRRQAILSRLKKGAGTNIKLISQAVQNRDSETAHYAASAVTSYKSQFLSKLKEISYEYDKDKDNYEQKRIYSNYVLEYLNSVELAPIERSQYLHLFLQVMSTIDSDYNNLMEVKDYSIMVEAYLDLSDGHSALKYGQECLRRFPDEEASYLNLLKIYYQLGYNNEFMDILQQLKRTDIFLSKESLELIRFFS